MDSSEFVVSYAHHPGQFKEPRFGRVTVKARDADHARELAHDELRHLQTPGKGAVQLLSVRRLKPPNGG